MMAGKLLYALTGIPNTKVVLISQETSIMSGLPRYADSNHETYACIDPGNGCADAAFLPDATTEGGYRDLIVNKSQILDYTGNSNYITGFAVRLPDETDTTEMDEMRYTNSRVITGS